MTTHYLSRTGRSTCGAWLVKGKHVVSARPSDVNCGLCKASRAYRAASTQMLTLPVSDRQTTATSTFISMADGTVEGAARLYGMLLDMGADATLTREAYRQCLAVIGERLMIKAHTDGGSDAERVEYEAACRIWHAMA